MPEADFLQELLKALALLSINAKQKQSEDNAVLKGIAWAQVSCNDPHVLKRFSPLLDISIVLHFLFLVIHLGRKDLKRIKGYLVSLFTLPPYSVNATSSTLSSTLLQCPSSFYLVGTNLLDLLHRCDSGLLSIYAVI